MQFVILLSVFTFSAGVKLPSNFQKCNRKNRADLDDCMLKAAQHAATQLTHAYDELNIPNLEPFHLLEATIGEGNGPVSVSQKFKNCNIYGLNKLQMDTFRFDFEKKTLTIDGVFPEINLQCDYETKGRVLVFPVDGKGNSTINLKNLKIAALFQYREAKRKDKTHIKFTSGDFAMDPELVTYDFLNHEDRTLSDHLNPVLNENWKEVFNDVKSDYIEIIKHVVLKLLNGFFGKVSLEEALD